MNEILSSGTIAEKMTGSKTIKKTGSSPQNVNNEHGRGALNPVNTATSVKASISTMHHFNEFVKAFCDFGSDMVHLIRITAGMLKFISTFFDQKLAVAILEKLTFVDVIML